MVRFKPANRGPLLAILAAVAAVVAAGVVFSAALIHHGQARNSAQWLRPSGLPPSVSTKLAYLMALSTLPGKQAPDFSLTDQNGRVLSLSSLRGKVVVLEFMDPHCVNICPIVSDEFIHAYHDLGASAHNVVFAAVNVNQYHPAVSAVARFSREHQLSTIPDWHFFTGPVPRLRAVWHAYSILVQSRGPNADVIHSSAIYFIDGNGRERYLSAPMADYTKSGTAYLPAGPLAEWGLGIALVASHLVH